MFECFSEAIYKEILMCCYTGSGENIDGKTMKTTRVWFFFNNETTYANLGTYEKNCKIREDK